MDIEEKAKELEARFDSIINKLENKTLGEEESKKKNSHLHIFVETSLLNKLKEEAEDNAMSLSEWCRKKLRGNSQLDRIETKLDKLLKEI